MQNHTQVSTPGACLICGKPLRYFPEERELTCALCGKTFREHVTCEDGHYICNACHAKDAILVGQEVCLQSHSTDPIAIMEAIMDQPAVHMHGPEHHVLVGSALLTAYANAGGQLDLRRALREMRERGKAYPGGSCGFWGACGAAVSAGMFFSIVQETTPLSADSWGLANQLTGRALQRIGAYGGPRCCKRDSYSALLETIDFIHENMNVPVTRPDHVVCHYFSHNRECLGAKCPYFPQ